MLTEEEEERNRTEEIHSRRLRLCKKLKQYKILRLRRQDKEQLGEEQLEEELRDYEDSEEKEYYKYYYGDLKEENMSKKEHEFILYITENIIRECAGTELDYESVEKMIYNIYPRVCTLFKRDMLKKP